MARVCIEQKGGKKAASSGPHSSPSGSQLHTQHEELLHSSVTTPHLPPWGICSDREVGGHRKGVVLVRHRPVRGHMKGVEKEGLKYQTKELLPQPGAHLCPTGEEACCLPYRMGTRGKSTGTCFKVVAKNGDVGKEKRSSVPPEREPRTLT